MCMCNFACVYNSTMFKGERKTNNSRQRQLIVREPALQLEFATRGIRVQGVGDTTAVWRTCAQRLTTGLTGEPPNAKAWVRWTRREYVHSFSISCSSQGVPDGGPPMPPPASLSTIFRQCCGRQTHTSGNALISVSPPSSAGGALDPLLTPLSLFSLRTSQSSALSLILTPVAHPSSQIPMTLIISPRSRSHSSCARGWYAQSVATASPDRISS